MGFFDRIKRKIQAIIPGGKTGKEGLPTEAGVPSFTREEVSGGVRAPVGSKIIEKGATAGEVLRGERTSEVTEESRSRQTLDLAREKQGLGPASDEEAAMFLAGQRGPIEAAKQQLSTDPVGAITDVLAVSGIGGIAKGIGGITAGARNLLARGGGSVSKIAAEAARLGIDEKKLTAAVNAAARKNAIRDLATLQSRKTFVGLTKKQLTLAIAGVVTVAGGISGASTLTTWLASDNLAGFASMTISNIESKFRNSEITREDAIEQINEQVEIIEFAQGTINTSTMTSPFLWAFRNAYMKNVENILSVTAGKLEFITNLEETTGEEFQRLREEKDEAQAERDEMFSRQREKEADEDEAQFRERTLLFEAIRKRNAGSDLTVEEMTLLIKFGLDIRIERREEFGRSALNFGGLF